MAGGEKCVVSNATVCEKINLAIAGAIIGSLAWMAACGVSLWDCVKKSSSDCNFRLNLLCLALVMFAPLIACSISAAAVLNPGSDDPKLSRLSSPYLFLVVVCVAPFGLVLSACMLWICFYVLFQLFSLSILLLVGLEACINPATFRDGAHAHDEVVVNVGGNENDCDHVLPNAVTRLEDSQSGETSIPVAIAADPGRDPMLSRVQELERELAILRSQRG